MLLPVNLPARLVLFLVQVATLHARQLAVGLVRTLELTDVALGFAHTVRLAARAQPKVRILRS